MERERSETRSTRTELVNTDHDSTMGRSIGLGMCTTECVKNAVICAEA